MSEILNYFNKLKFYSVKRKTVHVLVIIEKVIHVSFQTLHVLLQGTANVPSCPWKAPHTFLSIAILVHVLHFILKV